MASRKPLNLKKKMWMAADTLHFGQLFTTFYRVTIWSQVADTRRWFRKAVLEIIIRKKQKVLTTYIE